MSDKVQRKRDKQLHIFLSEDELCTVNEKMKKARVDNLSSYLRRMATEGKIVRIDIDEIKEFTAMLGRINGNFNQIAKKVNLNYKLYSEDIELMKKELREINVNVNCLLGKLAAMQ